MKSKTYIFFILLILIPLVNASILTVENENPQPHETIIGIISSPGGIDTTLTKSDLIFYKNGLQKTPQEYDIHFYDGNYYFYFIFSEEGNYTLIINDVLYKTDSGAINYEDINKTFELIEDNQTSVLQIKPGIVYGYNDLNLNLINKGDIDLSVSIGADEYEITSGDSKIIQLGEQEKLSFLEIKSYKTFTIPVISLSTPTNIGEKNNESEQEDLEINDGKNLEYAVEQGKREDYSFLIASLTDNNITEIEISSDIDGLTILTSPDELVSKENDTINIKLKISELGLLNGNLIISYMVNEEAKSLIVPITIYVSEEEVSLETLDTSEDNQTCEDRGILICESDESCSGGTITICEDGSVGCIDGTCITLNTSNNPTDTKGKGWVAVLIAVIVIALLAFVILQKYKKIK